MRKKIIDLHWKLFMWNGAYFLISLPFVIFYSTIRWCWYKSQGKNYWGKTPEEVEKEIKEGIEDFYSRIFPN